jgi:hypothetical protein
MTPAEQLPNPPAETEDLGTIPGTQAPLRRVPPPPRPAWYELDRYQRYRDLFLAIGFLILLSGIAMISKPAAIICAGVGLMILAYLMSVK